MKPARFAILSFLAAALFSCEEKVACTEIGCSGGLTISFVTEEGTPINDASGMMIIDGVEHPFDCMADPNFPQEIECVDNTIFFETEEAESIEFLVTNGDFCMGWEGTPEVQYEAQYTNGESCPAACYTASVQVVLNEV